MSWAGLGAAGAGYMPALQQLQQKAQMIQEAQTRIDASKRELQAQASLFQSLPAGAQPPGNAAPGQTAGGQAPMGQQGPQPMPPGQSSQPMMQQPPGGGGGGAQVPPMSPQASPQGGPGMGAPPQQAGAPGAGGQDLSPQAQMQLLTQIAQGIKQRSPGIDPLTLFEAVKQQISLMGALSNTQKQQIGYTLEQLKEQSRAAMQGQKDADAAQRQADEDKAKADRQGQHDTSVSGDVKTRVQGMLKATQARIDDADARLNQTQAAINARQDKSLQGRAANKAQTERLKLMRDKVAQAKQTLASANASMDPAKIAAAQQAVDAALAQVTDFQAKVVRGAAGPAVGGDAPAGGDNSSVLAAAKDAIAKGAPRDAVIQRLKDQGIDPAGL